LLADVLATTGPAILIGSSMGGAVAMMQAAHDPRSVRAVVLTGALLPAHDAGRSSRASFVRFVLSRLRRRFDRLVRVRRIGLDRRALHAAGLRAVVADPRSIDPVVLAASELDASEQGVIARARAHAHAAWSSMRLLSRPQRFAGVLDRVACPVLVVHGRDDPIVPVRFAVAAARSHPAWDLAVLDGVGHLPHVEDREGWLSAVRPWIDQNSG
jgi:pimeloyl-ACP methyl ester carboxylesterase